MNVFQYSAVNQARFNETMREFGHESKTTFFGDLSIAEWCQLYLGERNAIQETFDNVKASWLGNVEYFTEFVVALNHKIWQWYEQNDELARLYDKLWREASELAETTFKGKDLEYYYAETD